MKRGGWTLVEAAVAVVLLAVIIASVGGALVSGQRAARDAGELRVLRAELRDAAAVLGREIRGTATADTIRFASDTAFEFFAPILAAVTCAPSAGARLLLSPLPPRLPAPPATIAPDTGDLVWIFREDSVLPPGHWTRTAIDAYNPTGSDSCDPDLTAFGSQPRVLAVSPETGALDAGAPVVIVRRGRYSIYRASDGAWYLGYRRCDALGPSRCQAVQPVAGPYRARAGGEAGIEFRYVDSTGVDPAPTRQSIWRVDLVVRSDTASPVRRGMRRRAVDDSTVLSIAVRNAF
jgi:type II secretory pathway pseudopilin PulG